MTSVAVRRLFLLRLGILARFRLSLALLLATVVYGVVGYQLVESWSLLDSIYMTVITISTVGFREVSPLGAGGQIFTISLILLGLVTVFSALGIATELVASGDLAKWIRRRRLEKRVGRLSGHFIICGFGRVGRFTGEEFAREGIPFLVIDRDAALSASLAEMRIACLNADATEEAVLLEAGIERARGLVAAVDSDEANLSITLTARALNPYLTIVARSSRPESIEKLQRAGADRATSADALGGTWMAFLALRPAVPDFFEMVTVDPELGFEEVDVRPGSPLDSKTVGEARSLYPGSLILSLTRDETAPRPFPDDDVLLVAGDRAIVAGTVRTIDAMVGRSGAHGTVRA